MSIRLWFGVVPYGLRERFDRALGWIDRVHYVVDPVNFEQWTRHSGGDRQIPLGQNCVPVEQTHSVTGETAGAYYSSRVEQDWSATGPLMLINPDGADIEGTVVHECWHLIQEEMIHHEREFPPAASESFGQLNATLRKTGSFKHCQWVLNQKTARHEVLLELASSSDEVKRRSAIVLNDVEYSASMKEWLARAYSQSIRHRNRNQRDAINSTEGQKVDLMSNEMRLYLSEAELEAYDYSLDGLLQVLKWSRN